MRVLIVGLGLAAVLSLSGCGLASCASLAGDGQCRGKKPGWTYQFVHRGETLQIPSMSVKLGQIVTRRSIDPVGKADNGMWAIASLTLTNRLKSPQSYDNDYGQMALFLPSQRPVFETLGFLADSCGVRVRRLAPHHSAACKVLFDVDTNAADRYLRGSYYGQRGTLVVVNFGNDVLDLGDSFLGTTPMQPIGAIRLTP